MRAITLLLAVVMMTGAPGQLCASPDLTSVIDDAPDLNTPVVPAQVTAPLPDQRVPVCIEAPRSHARGRMHAVLVFRPPRLVASR